jgi:beta-lactamase class D
MHGRIPTDRAVSRRRTISVIAGAVAGIAAAADAAVPPRHNRWLDGDRPAPWPMEVVRFTDAPDPSVPTWTGQRTFTDGTIMRVASADVPGRADVPTIEFTLPDGRRLGPAPLHPWTSIWYVEVWRGNLDADADPEFIVVLPYSSNGSIFPSRVKILDPLGSPDAASRPLSVQGLDGLDPEARDVMDLDGDGRPEFFFTDMITATASQTVEGRQRNFFAMRPYRLQDGLLRDLSAELPGGPWPYIVWYSTASRSNHTTRIRPEAMDDVLASGWFRGPWPPPGRAPVTARPEESTPELAAVFADAGVDGSIIILPLAADAGTAAWEFDRAANDRRSAPASSFKPVHAIAALSYGAIESLDERFAWDGTDHGWFEWNRDLTVREAIEVSAVWVFRRIAERMPREQYADFLATLGYGDGPPRSAATDAAAFWLDGSLLVSPREQVEALRRLLTGAPGGAAPPRLRLAALADAMPAVRGNGWVVRGKSGWSRTPAGGGPADGWYVGWVERDGEDPVCFATRIALTAASDGPKREAITLACLRAVGVLPPE